MRYTVCALGLLACTYSLRADDWPQWMGPKRDNIWRESGLLQKFPPGGPKVQWRAKVAGGYSGPAVVDGRVFVGDFMSSADPKLETYRRTDYKGTERILCFEEKSGKLLWKHEYPMRYTISFPNGPRVTCNVNDGRVYFVGGEGRLSCLEAASGKLLWEQDYQKDFGAKTPLWGVATQPFIDGDKLICIVGGEGACVVAFDKKSGRELWRAMNAAEPGYGSPALVEVDGQRQLLIWHAESVNALDPDTGKRIWNVPLKATSGSAIMAPVLHGEHLFVGGFSHQCKGLKLTQKNTTPELLWTGTRKSGVYPVNCQPFVENGYIYGVCQDGELRCVELATGKRVWETLEPVGGKAGQCVTAIMVKNGDRFVFFNDSGEVLFAKLSPTGYEEISRAKVIEPTGRSGGRDVVYCAPAWANKNMYVRNDKELICVSLSAE